MPQKQQRDELLWEQFNLAEKNPDQGGAILYSLRYPAEQVQLKREAVVRALKENGVKLQEEGEFIAAVSLEDPGEEQRNKIIILLEELSILNSTKEYQDDKVDAKSIEDLKEWFLKGMYYLLLEKRDLVGAYEFIEMGMGQVIQDLQIAQAQNNVFTGRMKKEFKSFVDSQKRKADQLNRGNITVLGFSSED